MSSLTTGGVMARVYIKPSVAALIPPRTPVKEVAAALGVEYRVAYAFMVKHGIPRAPAGRRSGSPSAASVAERAARKRYLTVGLSLGMTRAEIGRALSRSKSHRLILSQAA